MNWKRITLATGLLGLLAVLAWVPAARAQGPGAGAQQPGLLGVLPELRQRPLGRFVAGGLTDLRQLRRDLNLTAAQQQQLFGVVEAHRPELRQVLGALRQGHRRVLDLSLQEELDEAAIRAATADLSGAAGDAAVLRAKLLRDCRAVLTPDQQAKLREFRESRGKAAEQALGAL